MWLPLSSWSTTHLSASQTCQDSLSEDTNFAQPFRLQGEDRPWTNQAFSHYKCSETHLHLWPSLQRDDMKWSYGILQISHSLVTDKPEPHHEPAFPGKMLASSQLYVTQCTQDLAKRAYLRVQGFLKARIERNEFSQLSSVGYPNIGEPVPHNRLSQ